MPLGDIRISSNFSLSSQRPLDDRTVVENDAERLALTLDRRYHLLRVDVADTNLAWQLVLGTVDQDLMNNANWIGVAVGSVLDNQVPLYADLVATVAAGGVEVGDTFQMTLDTVRTLFNAILAPYVASELTSIAISPGATVEVGRTITIVSATLKWEVDSETNPPKNATITGPGFTTAVLSISPQIVPTIPSTTVQKLVNTSQAWTFAAQDKDGVALASRTGYVTWQYRWFFGGNSILIVDDATAQTVIAALRLGLLKPGLANTVKCEDEESNPLHNTYICYAAKFGDISTIVSNNADSILGAFTKLGDFNFNNAEGQTVSYRVYRSNATGAVQTDDTLVIT